MFVTHYDPYELDLPAGSQPSRMRYDVVIVGARAAGAATAMLLARAGLSVLAIDRQTYGSDTLSTHALMRGAMARLARWGLLDQVWATDTPAINAVTFMYGGVEKTIEVRPTAEVEALAAPRRTALDPILVDAARASGAEVLHSTALVDLVTDRHGRVVGAEMRGPDGRVTKIAAGLVIGADGLRSSVGRRVGAPVTRAGEHASATTFAYYRGLDVDRNRYQWLYDRRDDVGIGGGVIPTTDDLTCVFTATPPAQFAEQARRDVAAYHAEWLRALDAELPAKLARAEMVGALRSWPGNPGRFVKPHGPGWALVGDAGYFKDPFAAHGITDAFRDAELLTEATLTGDFAGYEERRDETSRELFDVLERISSYEWDLEQLAGLHFKLAAAMKAEDEATLPALT